MCSCRLYSSLPSGWIRYSQFDYHRSSSLFSSTTYSAVCWRGTWSEIRAVFKALSPATENLQTFVKATQRRSTYPVRIRTQKLSSSLQYTISVHVYFSAANDVPNKPLENGGASKRAREERIKPRVTSQRAKGDNFSLLQPLPHGLLVFNP